MKKESLLIVTIWLAAFALLTGCIHSSNSLETGADVINILEIKPKDLEEPIYGQQNLAAIKAANGANDFAFQLSSKLSSDIVNENFVCSPYSVWIPLAALVNATDARNKNKLLASLNASGINESDINNAASRMLYDLTKQRDKGSGEFELDFYHDPLEIANAIFVGNNVIIKKDFAQAFMDYYRGSMMNVDFKSADAVIAVNKWASENTAGLISEIIQEFDPYTVAAIANAIYFSDRWEWEFDPSETAEDIFYPPSGESKAFYMLREGNNQEYYEDDKVQAMPLKFKTGDGMYIILPKDGDAKKLLLSMTSDYFNEIQRDSIHATGKLLLPRFTIDGNVMELKDALTALGVPLFDKDTAALTGGLVEENIPVWLSSGAHKAVIEVDEKGTTAAAVTVMTVATTGMPIPNPTKPFEMNCNKPFVFVLYGNTYDGGKQVLFTGMVNKP